ncbi:response regulator [Paenibacillus hamazuiensis]|uniref:response regulator n=1 Tax=Paenibacillus hamazuiensis TaxID=2936508 RepID=UPI002010017F|nr:response regulator [Paenibacillus hamazuiensis]
MYRVVLVDDEPIILRSLKVALPWEELGIAIVGEAANGEEGLAVIRSAKPDIVISDIRMPMLDGISMMKEAGQREGTPLFVLLSGYGEFEYAREALRHGAFDYLLKPIDHEELESVMREAKTRLDQEAEIHSERDYLTRSAQALSSLVRERLIGSMLEGGDKPFDPSYWLRGWDLEHPYAMLVIALDDMLEVARWSREDRKLWFFAVGNVLTEYGEKCGAFTVFPFRSGEWVMLLQHADSSRGDQADAEIGRIAEEIIRLVKSCTKLSCSVGISRKHSGVSELYACYRSASHALLARFAGGRERVYADAQPSAVGQEAGGGTSPRSRTAAAALPGWELRLAEAMAGFDKPRLAAHIGRLTGDMREGDLHQEEAAALMIELSVGLSRRLADLCGKPLPQLQELIAQFPQCGTLDEAERLLAATLERYIDEFADDVSREEEKRSIRKAMDYMAERYHYDLGIDEVAEFAGLSCSHFCVLFKKESGVTFLEYLTQLRIDRACSILRNTEVKVYQVAPLVGYRDPKYFTQVFKKLKGKTPSEYRTAVQL